MPPQEEEDWENEIQEVTLTHSENNCDNIQPYGKEKTSKYSDFFLHSTVRIPYADVTKCLWCIHTLVKCIYTQAVTCKTDTYFSFLQ